MAQNSVTAGAAAVAVMFAALIGTVIVIAQALVRLAARLRGARRRGRGHDVSSTARPGLTRH